MNDKTLHRRYGLQRAGTFFARILPLILLIVCTVALSATAVSAAEEERKTMATVRTPDGTVTEFRSVEDAIAAVAYGDELTIMEPWLTDVSVLFPVGVTVVVQPGVYAGSSADDVEIRVLGSLKSAGMLVGNWQLQGRVSISFDTDGDGNVDEVQEVVYGNVPTHTDGVRKRDGMYVYNFAGWDRPFEPATENVTYTAKFTRVVAEYTVGWDLNGDGTSDVIDTYPFGETPIPPADGSRPDDVARTYRFVGWGNEIVPVTGDTVYTAVFSSSAREYTIRWDKDGDGAPDVTEQKSFGSPLIPEVGVHASSDEWKFSFDCWTPTPDTVVGDAFYIAQFIPSSQKDANVSCKGTLTVNLLNRYDAAVAAIVTLESNGQSFGARQIGLESGINGALTFENLPDGVYTLSIRDSVSGGCMNCSLVTVKDGIGVTSVLLSGYAPLVDVTVEKDLSVLALNLPNGWLTHIAAEDGDGLTAADWSTERIPGYSVSISSYRSDAPFHETLEKAAENQKIGLFLHLSVNKTVGGGTKAVMRTTEPITVVLRLSESAKSSFEDRLDSLKLYYVVSGSTETVSEVPNLYGEYYEWDEFGNLRLHLRGNAVYALACDQPESSFPLWWIMLLVDLAGAFVLFIDRRKKSLDYPIRLTAALAITAVVVVVLSIRQGVMEIIFASIGWLLLTLLIILSGSGSHRNLNDESFQLKFDFTKRRRDNDNDPPEDDFSDIQ